MSVTLSMDLTKLSDQQLIRLMSQISEVLGHRFHDCQKSKKHEHSHRMNNIICHKKFMDSNDHAVDPENFSVLDMKLDDIIALRKPPQTKEELDQDLSEYFSRDPRKWDE